MIKNIMRNIKEMFRDKSHDIKDAQSYRTEAGDIVDNFSDQQHINMVDSTAIDSVKYNKKDGTATVKFRNGDKSYDFPNVPPEVIDNMNGAPSKGRYYWAFIKPYSTNQ